MKGLGIDSPAPLGVISPGSIECREEITLDTPPPAAITATRIAIEAITIIIPCIVSVRITARKPPTVV